MQYLHRKEIGRIRSISRTRGGALPMAMVQHVRLSGGDSYNENGCLKVQYCPGSNLRASLAAISSANSKVSPGLSPINSLFKVGLDNPFLPNGIVLQPVNIDANNVGGKDGSGSILPQQPRLRRRSAHRLQGCHQLSHWVPDTPELIQILRSHEIQANI